MLICLLDKVAKLLTYEQLTELKRKLLNLRNLRRMKINNGDSNRPTDILQEGIKYLTNSLALFKIMFATDILKTRYTVYRHDSYFSNNYLHLSYKQTYHYFVHQNLGFFMIPSDYFYFPLWRLKMWEKFPKEKIWPISSHFVTFQSYIFYSCVIILK